MTISKLIAGLQQWLKKLFSKENAALLEHLKALQTQLQEKEQKLKVLEAMQLQTPESQQALDELNQQLQEAKRQQSQVAEQVQQIADLTAKLDQLEIELSEIASNQRQALAQNIVKNHMIAGVSTGLLPLPLLDIALLSGAQLNLLRSLSQHYQLAFNEKQSRVLLTSLIGGSLPVLVTVGLSSFTKWIPGIGSVGGGISVATLAGAVTFATGQVFIRHFEAGGTLEDFESKQWRALFKQQFEKSKTSLSEKLRSSKNRASTTAANTA